MNEQTLAELIWYRRSGEIRFAVRPLTDLQSSGKGPLTARFPDGGPPISILKKPVTEGVVYRCPTTLNWDGVTLVIGDVFAILAGEGKDGFNGARLNFRDVIEQGKQERAFIYVVAVNDVTDASIWQGYVRLGHRKWLRIPVPRPQAMYNRIPTRALERRPSAQQARRILTRLQIPLFNPSYFSKSNIYDAIRTGGLGHYLPETLGGLDKDGLLNMVSRHPAVYLKPSGGSVGHGMIRIDVRRSGYAIAVLKNGRTTRFTCTTANEVWTTIERERVVGKYVVQQAIPLTLFRGNPCDFRVLLQKRGDDWILVGRGVRVSGEGRITTHVPNGGSIANATIVLQEAFGVAAGQVDAELESFVLRAAKAIDDSYAGALGEMSMDIGIDAAGIPWFFEANAKPMKFDEPDIRAHSLQGIIAHLRHRANE